MVRPGGKSGLADFDAAGFRVLAHIYAAEGPVHARPYRREHIAASLRRAGFRVQRACGEKMGVAGGAWGQAVLYSPGGVLREDSQRPDTLGLPAWPMGVLTILSLLVI